MPTSLRVARVMRLRFYAPLTRSFFAPRVRLREQALGNRLNGTSGLARSLRSLSRSILYSWFIPRAGHQYCAYRGCVTHARILRKLRRGGRRTPWRELHHCYSNYLPPYCRDINSHQSELLASLIAAKCEALIQNLAKRRRDQLKFIYLFKETNLKLYIKVCKH